MSLALPLEPFNLSKNLLSYWPYDSYIAPSWLVVYIFNWLKGISGQRHFDRKKFRFWITGLIGTKHTRKGISKNLPRSEEIPIFVSSCIFNTSCQISINALYQSLHIDFIIICPGCTNGTAQRFPDGLQWPMAGLSWAQTLLSAQAFPMSWFILITNDESLPCCGKQFVFR